MKALYIGPDGPRQLNVVEHTASALFSLGLVSLADDAGAIVVEHCPVSAREDVLADAAGNSVFNGPPTMQRPDIGFAVLPPAPRKVVAPEPDPNAPSVEDLLRAGEEIEKLRNILDAERASSAAAIAALQRLLADAEAAIKTHISEIESLKKQLAESAPTKGKSGK